MKADRGADVRLTSGGRSVLLRYGLAVLAPVIALILSQAVSRLTGETPPFLLFFVPVLLSAWYGGFGPGVCSSFLASVGLEFIAIASGNFLGLSKYMVVRIGLFFPEAVLISWFIASRREALLRLAALVRHSDDAIIGATLDGTITSWNSGAEQIYGYLAAEMIGHPFTVLVPPEHAAEEQELKARVERGEPVRRFETVQVRKDGTRVDVSLTMSRIKDITGELIGVSVVARDITERKWAERDRARLFDQLRTGRERTRRLAQRALAASEEERRRLSRELHDEASQMFTVLKIKLGLLRADPPSDVAALRERLDQLISLTDSTDNQLRAVARSLRPPVLDTLGLSAGLEDLCREFAQRAGLIVDYQGIETLKLSETVSTCLYRVVQEALTNVAKHANAQHVEVRLLTKDGTLQLSVADDGQGFDVAASQTGLGLEGMRERIDLLGGRLEIEMQPAAGARLVIQIPCEEQT
ncbi:MAG TPA: PAS domain S-box protein [Verrucomicrobiae bacterium]|nr:PAS domain S-box protein [Verrucomicrobiae bacterium]